MTEPVSDWWCHGCGALATVKRGAFPENWGNVLLRWSVGSHDVEVCGVFLKKLQYAAGYRDYGGEDGDP